MTTYTPVTPGYTVEYFGPRDRWLVMEPGGFDICECKTEAQAQRIAAALNAAAPAEEDGQR